MSDLEYAFIGSTEDAKTILEKSNIDPSLILSFTDEKEETISGFTRYPEYGDIWRQVQSINSNRARKLLRDADIDVGFVISWQELLDGSVLEIPSRGFVGRHLSLLPKRRGRAPVAWALIHGLETTGQTLFWLDRGVDSGDILAQTDVKIDWKDEASDLFEKQAAVTVSLLDDVLESFNEGTFPRTPQKEHKATYTHPRRPDMGLIDWTHSASRLYNFIRGQSRPYPGAFTYNAMDRIRVWHANVNHSTALSGKPGEILQVVNEEQLVVQSGEGILQIKIEREANKHEFEKGKVLGSYTNKMG